jgi:DNA-binding MarR family transcriptional regulator
MKLEQEIKSIKPMPPLQKAVLNILFTASWLECQQQRRLKRYKISGPQYNILRILNGSWPKGLTLLDIKSRMLDRSSNVSRLVEKLRKADLLERVPCAEDRRAVIVTIGEKGKALLTEIEPIGAVEGQNQPGRTLTEAEIMLLGDLLDRFRE